MPTRAPRPSIIQPRGKEAAQWTRRYEELMSRPARQWRPRRDDATRGSSRARRVRLRGALTIINRRPCLLPRSPSTECLHYPRGPGFAGNFFVRAFGPARAILRERGKKASGAPGKVCRRAGSGEVLPYLRFRGRKSPRDFSRLTSRRPKGRLRINLLICAHAAALVLHGCTLRRGGIPFFCEIFTWLGWSAVSIRVSSVTFYQLVYLAYIK